jgi:hypothetical protein
MNRDTPRSSFYPGDCIDRGGSQRSTPRENAISLDLPE